jgi:hypothetical protein
MTTSSEALKNIHKKTQVRFLDECAEEYEPNDEGIYRNSKLICNIGYRDNRVC